MHQSAVREPSLTVRIAKCRCYVFFECCVGRAVIAEALLGIDEVKCSCQKKYYNELDY